MFLCYMSTDLFKNDGYRDNWDRYEIAFERYKRSLKAHHIWIR